MTALLRRWGPLGGAGLIGALLGALTLGVTRCDVALGEAAARASRDTSVNGRLEVLERDAVELREFRVRLRHLEAGQAAMLAWMAAVSPRLGVPPPPAPSAARMQPSQDDKHWGVDLNSPHVPWTWTMTRKDRND